VNRVVREQNKLITVSVSPAAHADSGVAYCAEVGWKENSIVFNLVAENLVSPS